MCFLNFNNLFLYGTISDKKERVQNWRSVDSLVVLKTTSLEECSCFSFVAQKYSIFFLPQVFIEFSSRSNLNTG